LVPVPVGAGVVLAAPPAPPPVAVEQTSIVGSAPAARLELASGHRLRADDSSSVWAVYQLRTALSYETKVSEMEAGSEMLHGSVKVALSSHEDSSAGGVGRDS
jgi:hypothetical protein